MLRKSSFFSTMFTATVKLLVTAYAVSFCFAFTAGNGHDATRDCASSCGGIHNIRYPFRLNTDPTNCGNKQYELACQDDILFLRNSEDGEEYRVEAINYNNLTIRLVDPTLHMENCSLPVMSSSNEYGHTGIHKRILLRAYRDRRSDYNYLPWFVQSSSLGYGYNYRNTYENLILVSCSFPVTGKLGEFNSSCDGVAVNNSKSAFDTKRFWYVNVGTMNCSYLENSCRIEHRFPTSLLPEGSNNMSYRDVRNSLSYGFELSWESACCASQAYKNYNCSRAARNYFCSIPTFAEELLWFMQLLLCSALTLFVIYKVVLCFCGSPCVAFYLIYKWRRRHLSAYDNIEEFINCHQSYLMPVRYSYSEIKKMTKGFKQKLGEGGYGSVYKGKLQSGRFAAVKMLDKSKANGQEFINEIATIGRIHHANVVQLIGFCVNGSKRALIYEFMANGSLDRYLFAKEGCIPINNQKIYDICLGVALGIKYLHEGCNMQILHFDIKPHNILLDENFLPKISDFGLAKLHPTNNSIVSLTAARGTLGYMAPEFFYKNIGNISYKADVYSFGMLLLEMVGRRKNINAFTEHSSRIYFPSWIYEQISEEKDVNLGDGSEEENKIVKKMIIVALWCIQLNPKDRPSMHKVVELLEGDVENLQMPPKPFTLPQEVHTNDA